MRSPSPDRSFSHPVAYLLIVTASVTSRGRWVWPLKKGNVEMLQANLERLKTTLLLMLSVLSFARENAKSPAIDQTRVAVEKLQIENLVKAQTDANERYDRLLASFSRMEIQLAPTLPQSFSTFTTTDIASTASRHPHDRDIAHFDMDEPIMQHLNACASAVSNLSQVLRSTSSKWKSHRHLEYEILSEAFTKVSRDFRHLDEYHARSMAQAHGAPEPLNPGPNASLCDCCAVPEAEAVVKASNSILRNWFLPGDGIDRHVISADIQMYLGNDATVRPGMGTGDTSNVQGYWIKATRNLTSAMIADLRADSARWKQERRSTGKRESYLSFNTYHASSIPRPVVRHGDSPVLEGANSLPTTSKDSIQTSRMPQSRIEFDRMDIDPPRTDRGYPQESRGNPPDIRAYPPESTQAYAPEPPMPTACVQDPRHATSKYQANDGAPPGYVRQGNYYVSIAPYKAQSAMQPNGAQPQYQPQAYGQPLPPSRDIRGNPRYAGDPRDPRYAGQPNYSDPRYAHPGPGAVTLGDGARNRTPITIPPQFNYGHNCSSDDRRGGKILGSTSLEPIQAGDDTVDMLIKKWTTLTSA